MSLTIPHSSAEASPQRKRWRSAAILALCLLLGSACIFALDRALVEPDSAPEPPYESGHQPVSTIVHTYDGWMSEGMAAGEEAPDFRLTNPADGHEVHLASFRGRRPVVLIFGSFSCNVFHNEAAALEQFYREHRDQAEFLLVYVKEAEHEIPELDPILNAIPKGPDQRRQRVLKGRELLHLTIPTVLDSSDSAIQAAYQAFPRRMLVVDTYGHIAFDLGRSLQSNWDLARVDAWLRENTAH
jgi:peroxiredoxin